MDAAIWRAMGAVRSSDRRPGGSAIWPHGGTALAAQAKVKRGSIVREPDVVRPLQQTRMLPAPRSALQR
jgi:hypothetical protein